MLSHILSSTRQAINRAVRSKVGGDDFAEIHLQIWHTEGERWFTAADPIWRVHNDTSMYIGGMRALLLQSLHPVAMQAVSKHSGYRSDPWGRLQRTARFIAATTFGTISDAERAIAKVKHVHTFITGVAPDGTPYEATDPRLLRWVHIAEIESFLLAHQAFGARPLTDAECDTYVAQTAEVATRLGVIDPPTTRSELDSALMSYRRELNRTPAAVEAANLLLHHPPLPAFSQPGYQMMVIGALSLLPPWARARLRLPYRPMTEVLARPLAITAMKTLRWAFNSDPVVQAVD